MKRDSTQLDRPSRPPDEARASPPRQGVPPSATRDERPGSDPIPPRVGHIRLEHKIGEGGMGAVYAGYDERLARGVALKVIRRAHLRDETRDRFIREARMLSRLDDPRICRIYEYVEGDEHDLLVLELIAGRTLRTAMAEGLERRAKLRIAEELTQALLTAHAKGIVHRDIKPENVMLTDEGAVKVLDFGIARSLDESPSVAPSASDGGADAHPNEALTTVGSIIGTVGYMSPEQARGDPVTPASDMYSLGLVIQELFSGQRPIESALSPIAALAQAAQGANRPFADRDGDLAALVGRLKALAPEARPTAREVVERLTWIGGRARRRLRRLAAAGAVLIACGGALKYTFDLRRERNLALAARATAEEARLKAEQARDENREVVDFLVTVFQSPSPWGSQDPDVTAREVLDQGVQRIRQQLVERPLIRASLLCAMGRAYHHLGLLSEARELLEESIALYGQQDSPHDLALAESLHALARVDCDLEHYSEAHTIASKALAIRRELLGPASPELADGLALMADIERYLDRLGSAESLARQALAAAQQASAPDNEVAQHLYRLASILSRQQQYEDAEQLFLQSMAIWEAELGPGHPLTYRARRLLARVYWGLHRYDTAEPLLRESLQGFEQVLDRDHPLLASALSDLAINLWHQGRYEEMIPLHQRSLAISKRVYGRRHVRVARAEANLAEVHWKLGHSREAERLYQDALSIYRESGHAETMDYAIALRCLADLFRDERRCAAAERLYQQAMELHHGISPDAYGYDQEVRLAIDGHVELLRACGRAEEARQREEHVAGRGEPPSP